MSIQPVSNVLLDHNEEIEKSPFKIDQYCLKKSTLILRALSHKLRQQIIKLIYEHGTLTVTEIYVKLRLVQSVASQHLAILRKASIVSIHRDGKFIHYSINTQRLSEIEEFAKNIAG